MKNQARNVASNTQNNPATAKPSHLQCSDAKWDEILAMQAQEDFNFVPIGDYFVTVTLISEVHRHLLDTNKWDENIGVESIVKQSFWRSLDDESRNLIGPIVEFLKEHKEWFESIKREIAASAALLRGKHD